MIEWEIVRKDEYHPSGRVVEEVIKSGFKSMKSASRFMHHNLPSSPAVHRFSSNRWVKYHYSVRESEPNVRERRRRAS